jgi:tRNA pseudouridine38-40 synthase
MRNLKVMMSFNGAGYHGFQRQANAHTIQGTAEAALSRLLKENTPIAGCSRTDAGVHAREFCFSVRTGSSIPCEGLVRGLNALLPRDMAVHSCEEAADGFHARYSAESKEYVYLIHCGKIRDVFMRDMAYFCPRVLNLGVMSEAAALFAGEHDFSAYCRAESLAAVKSGKHGAVCRVYDFRVCGGSSEYIEIIVRGNRFLHNMVRIMTGTLVCVSEGKRSLADVRESLAAGNRESAGITLPACGLYLNRVFY